MSTQQIKAKAFRVTQELSELEVRTWREQGVTLTPLHVGDFGWIPLEPNLDENGSLRAVVAIQRAAYSNTGTGMVTPEDGGYTLALSRCLELGANLGSLRIRYALGTTRIPSRAELQTGNYRPDNGPDDTVFTEYMTEWLRALTEQHVIADESPLMDVSSRQFLLDSGVGDWFVDLAVKRPRDVINALVDDLDGLTFYIIIYKLNDSYAANYVGRTGDIRNRFECHRSSLENDWEEGKSLTPHYEVGRELIRRGSQWRMFPLAFIHRNAHAVTHLNPWVETSLICLFETYHSRILKESNSLSECIKFSWSRPLAMHLSQVTERTKNRPEFSSMQIVKADGCNWATPILESGHGIAPPHWNRLTIYDDQKEPLMWQFRSAPRSAVGSTVNGKDRLVFIPFRTKLHLLRIFCVTGVVELFPGLTKGDKVNMVFEVMVNPEKAHPTPYLHIPIIGPFDNYHQASRLGIRVEWKCSVTGQWKTRALHTNRNLNLVTKVKDISVAKHGEQVQHMTIPWAKTMKILAALLRWNWEPKPRFNDVIKAYNARVRDIALDFFTQTVTVRDINMQPTPPPRLMSLEENADRTEALFGENIIMGYQPHSDFFIHTGSQAPGSARKRCDICSEYKRACKQETVDVGGGVKIVTCDACKILRRYCVNTQPDDVKDGLLFKLVEPYPIYNITEPVSIEDMVNEIEENADEERWLVEIAAEIDKSEFE